ncbi:hypothetical protein QMG90_03525 [Trabulsiella odontotermitis]|uniref:hypothetical protein n=1 Tax=Trabulsiella odontotermitis TaxID=379893 RepID=UPI0024B82605|nr:hypothetical protein [Trabulsiella odontotermitis]WHP32024.1 hypothetical protein QMG90_03525 [Trabulsiella odontotermitis]
MQPRFHPGQAMSLVIKEMDVTLKNRIAIIFFCSLMIGAFWLGYKLSVGTLSDIINGKDTIYYNWRSVPIFSFLPVIVYFFIAFFLLIFFPHTQQLGAFLLSGRGMYYLSIYLISAFFISMLLSIIIYFYPLSSHYQQCDGSGIFSGIHFVKAPASCEQFGFYSGKQAN